SAVVTFRVSDEQSAVTLLTNSVISANTNLLPASSFVFAGNSTNRTLTITPPITESGVTTLTLTVTDPQGASATQTFSVTVLAPPALANFSFNGGAFQFQITGLTNYTYTIQASTNLVTWTNLLVTNPAALPFAWRDSQTNLPRRFYRVQTTP
ncbi:MAG: hypothetical protein WCS42_27330, partial [Verrucomicrobiota bacterium]